MILVGDFNAHHPMWGSASKNLNDNVLENFFDKSNYVLLNTTVPTHFLTALPVSLSLLDLTMVSVNIPSRCSLTITSEFLGSD